MNNSLPPLGITIVFEDDSDGLEKYGIVKHVSGATVLSESSAEKRRTESAESEVPLKP